ncbi:hypothetical protein SAMN06269185_0037 [Natronoarchaeum philippinense]|uniref:DUF7319 domain-containing protein n=1 Tax=Natronoarchaeum philippinense TaxID=558529 RepID=A0A285MZI7_NATPI|nr:hypothetical protein [Natronoarchaeum philippinense]SNZ02498.1 hypothetical protein SAMN06269185_0037 [Natronoarchaeum philippinense]
MSESSDERAGDDRPESESTAASPDESVDRSVEELRAEVEDKYDFDNFGPADMAEMSADEWDVAFDHDSWITGEELLDKIEQDLKRRIAERDVFAVVERVRHGDDELLIAYSDSDYALIYPDGTVEGAGTVLRDVQPTVALCSMDEYEPDPAPEADFLLPSPDDIPEQSNERGNLMLQIIAAAQLLAGVGLIGVSLYYAAFGGAQPGTSMVTGVAGLGFIGIAVFLFMTVANARLSDRFRTEEFRERLRSIGLEDGERPEFLPVDATDDGDLVFAPVERDDEAAE